MPDESNDIENPYRIPGRDEIEAYISQGGFICLKQINTHESDPSIVSIWPSDVPMIIGWLQALKAEADAAAQGHE